MQTTTVTVRGMHCSSCAGLVKDVSSEFPAIKSVNVDIDSKKIKLEHEENFDMKKWTQEIEALGEAYKVTTN